MQLLQLPWHFDESVSVLRVAHINPRRACAARVTVVGSVCVSVTFDLPSRMSKSCYK